MKAGRREDTQQLARRLPSVLDAHKPEVLLLQEGHQQHQRLCQRPPRSAALRTMIDGRSSARRRSHHRHDACRCCPRLASTARPLQARFSDLNAQIINLAAQYHLGLVDLFAFFDANQQLMGSDGLHPSAEGQTRIAELFRDEIVRRYDVSSTTSLRFSNIRSAR